MTFYVVHPWISMLDEATSEPGVTFRDWIEKNRNDLRKKRIWSISTDPNEEGWDTDNGYQSDGGLTYDEATIIVEAANRGIA